MTKEPGTISNPIPRSNETEKRGEVRVSIFKQMNGPRAGEWGSGVAMACDELAGTMYSDDHVWGGECSLALEAVAAEDERLRQPVGPEPSVIVEGPSETVVPWPAHAADAWMREATPVDTRTAYDDPEDDAVVEVEPPDSDAFDYYFEDEAGSVRRVRVIADDHRARGACSGIPSCCVEAYLALEPGPIDDVGWGYVPCAACLEADSRVEVLSCERDGGGRCMCGQWLASEVVAEDPHEDPPVITPEIAAELARQGAEDSRAYLERTRSMERPMLTCRCGRTHTHGCCTMAAEDA